MLRSNGDIVWSAGTALNGYRLYVQSDGNVIVRTSSKQAIWTSKTYGHAGAQLVVDDGGRLAVAEGDLAIWIQGIPRGTYSGRPATNLQFPIRGIFYYSVRTMARRIATHFASYSHRAFASKFSGTQRLGRSMANRYILYPIWVCIPARTPLLSRITFVHLTTHMWTS